MLSPEAGNPTYRHEKYMDEVHPNVWLGHYEAALDDQIAILRKHKITHIVSIGKFEEWWTTRKDPKHLLLAMKDSPFVFVTDYFGQAFPFMDEALNAGCGVLVHCEQGRSRSSAIVIAYLMKKLQKKYPETLNKVLLHRKKVMPNIGFQIQLRHFAKNRWNTNIQYSDKIDIEKELGNALKNLALQVTKFQSDINKKERLYVTITDTSHSNEDEKEMSYAQSHTTNGHKTNKEKEKESWKRHVVIGLDEQDLNIFRKEWLLLVFSCHQFQLYEIAVHKNTSNILFILGEMYFPDLLSTFQEVFEPTNKNLIMDYDDPSKSIAAALQIYAQKEREKAKT